MLLTAWCHILFCGGQVRRHWPYQPREGLFKEICLPTSEYNYVSGIATMATRFISIMFPVGAPATGSCILTRTSMEGKQLRYRLKLKYGTHQQG